MSYLDDAISACRYWIEREEKPEPVGIRHDLRGILAALELAKKAQTPPSVCTDWEARAGTYMDERDHYKARWTDVSNALRRLMRFTFEERWATKGLDEEAQKLHDHIMAMLAEPCTTNVPCRECGGKGYKQMCVAQGVAEWPCPECTARSGVSAAPNGDTQ